MKESTASNLKTWLVLGFFQCMVTFLSFNNQSQGIWVNEIPYEKLQYILLLLTLLFPLILLPLWGTLMDSIRHSNKVRKGLLYTSLLFLVILGCRFLLRALGLTNTVFDLVLMNIADVLSTCITLSIYIIIMTQLPKKQWFLYLLTTSTFIYIMMVLHGIMAILTPSLNSQLTLGYIVPFPLLLIATVILNKALKSKELTLIKMDKDEAHTLPQSTSLIKALPFLAILCFISFSTRFCGGVFRNQYYTYLFDSLKNSNGSTPLISLEFYLKAILQFIVIGLAFYMVHRKSIKGLTLIRGSLLLVLITLLLLPFVASHFITFFVTYLVANMGLFLLTPVIGYFIIHYIHNSHITKPFTFMAIAYVLMDLVSTVFSHNAGDLLIFSKINTLLENLSTGIIVIPIALFIGIFLIIKSSYIKKLIHE